MKNLSEIDKKNIWHPFTPLTGSESPLVVKSASGIYLHTQDGRKIIDAISSWWVNIHGHAHPYIAEALAEQAKKLQHVIFAGFTHEPAIQLSENLKNILPSNQEKIFFSDNGSTAVEVGLKMAFQYWYNSGSKKKSIIAFQGAYHGDTFGSMSIGERGLFTNPFSDYLFDVIFIDFPEKGNEEKTFLQFKTLLETHDVGAFIFEPLIQAAAGMRIYKPEILDKIISYAHKNNVITIADEVFTGFGRTGKIFASDYLTNKPDIITISKGLTGGTLPLGVTSCSKKIISAFETDDFSKTFFHGHSYTANPLACTAANASYALLMEEKCNSSIKLITQQQQKFKDILRNHNKVKDVRCLGTLLALEINTNENTSYANAIRKKIYPYFIDRNILLRPLGNVIYVLPPYVISEDELSNIHSTILQFLNEC